MSDDFGTVNIKPGGREREFEALRQQFQRLRNDVDAALRRLDEMSALSAGGGTSPGTRPLVTPIAEPVTDHGAGSWNPPERLSEPDAAGGGSSRALLMVVIGAIVLAAIGYLIWRASSDRKAKAAPQVIEQPATTPAADTADTAPPAPAAATTPAQAAAGGGTSIRITPAVADYGTIRKGTRAVRQFEVANATNAPITIQVARSACRCLYYDYNAKLAPKKKETITVTVDGARAKAGALSEDVAVSSKDDPSATGTLGVRAVIQ